MVSAGASGVPKVDKKEQGVEGNVLEKPVSIWQVYQVASDNRLLFFSSGSSEEPTSCQVKVTENFGVQDFELLKVVGKGAFGKVFQVKRKGTSEIYAMKVISKDIILKSILDEYMERIQDEYIKAESDNFHAMKFMSKDEIQNEAEILTKIVHPFIVQLRYSFQVIVFLLQFKL